MAHQIKKILSRYIFSTSLLAQASYETEGVTHCGSCLKTGQHFIFIILYLLLLIKYIFFDSVSKILFKKLCIKAKDSI